MAWASLVYFATVLGPFVATGNGFFAAWGGLVFGALALASEGADAAGNPLLLSPSGLATQARVQLRCVGLASFVVFVHAEAGGLASAALQGDDRKPAYALAAACVSLGLVLVLLLHRALKPAEAAALLSTTVCACASGGRGGGAWSVEACVALFLSAWWAAAAGMLTFSGPFIATTNPYFASWAITPALAPSPNPDSSPRPSPSPTPWHLPSSPRPSPSPSP